MSTTKTARGPDGRPVQMVSYDAQAVWDLTLAKVASGTLVTHGPDELLHAMGWAMRSLDAMGAKRQSAKEDGGAALVVPDGQLDRLVTAQDAAGNVDAMAPSDLRRAARILSRRVQRKPGDSLAGRHSPEQTKAWFPGDERGG